jgi:hypothetical protein
MIFRPEHCDKILRHEKTQTRRLVHDGDQVERDATGAIIAVRRLTKKGWRDLYRVDYSYAFCPGRGQRQLGRFIITRIRQERVREIDTFDAAAEGCDGLVAGRDGERIILSRLVDHYALVWDSINRHPYAWGDNPPIYALTFEVGP